ncbi:subtilase [Xylaria scruposa]|nr:subtilase [Xylaria scruposa]
MDLLKLSWLRAAPPVYDKENIYHLLIAVLPTFIALAEDTGKDDETGFCLDFRSKLFNLHAVLHFWNPTELVQRLSKDEDEVRNNLLRVLDELESRFLSWKSIEAALAGKRLGLGCKKDETYPKLRTLRGILGQREDCEELMSTLTNIIRIYNKNVKKRQQLLKNLDQACNFFYSLLPAEAESDSSCPMRFSDYPMKHLRELTKILFNVIQKNWLCQRPSCPSHNGRKTRLNLTHHQHFGIAPTQKYTIPDNRATFRILFPTNSDEAEWQDTEIAIKHQDLEFASHSKVEDGLCRVIQGAKPGIRPRMVIFGESLWQLRADPDINQLSYPQVRDRKFKSLKDLLQLNRDSRTSWLSYIGGKDRLILSFILATSLMHFVRGPWLWAGLNSENICFLMLNSRYDITNPYLATTYSSLAPRESRELDQPHCFPEILSLGILLLEIARGFTIDFEESQDRCVVALDFMDKWTRQFPGAPEGLRKAISACINPTVLRNNGLDKMLVTDLEVRKYIFEKILYPLHNALSEAYMIESNTLHANIARVKNMSGIGCFDHEDENRLEKREMSRQWLEPFEDLRDLVNDLLYADQKTVHVKIAILDTGLQLPGALQENYEDAMRIDVQQSETFVPPTTGETNHEWRVDDDGHGTRVSQIILKFAPAADLHIAKVFKTRKDLEDPGLATQVHTRIVDAINRATNEWEVDMIVMCFGFDRRIDLIRDAIDEASKAKKSPLFFAATRNDGAHKLMAWPAKSRSVIGISSTDGSGEASSFNPSDKGADPVLYAFGEGVPVDVADPANPGKLVIRHVSGTSYATPVAVALAANLLGCVRMVLATSEQEEQTNYNHILVELQRLDGMLAVLKHHMQMEHNCGTKSLLPWDFLNNERLKHSKILKDIAETLSQV